MRLEKITYRGVSLFVLSCNIVKVLNEGEWDEQCMQHA